MKTFVQAIIPRNSHPNQPIKAIFLFKQDFGYIKVFILDVQFYQKHECIIPGLLFSSVVKQINSGA
ncbi:MAG: hypothetical protein CMP12_13210 [Zunongwangia sp.]|nr:hypothetical protein [Flavobacteriaceae bacterium]MAO36837.1 hypothetical protein [Zunongwangia sp.]